jgi:hypothetical protein
VFAAANVLDATPRSRNVLWVWLRYSTTHLLHCTLLHTQPRNLGSRRARKGTRVHAIHVRMPHVERCKCPAVYADEIFVPNRSRTYVVGTVRTTIAGLLDRPVLHTSIFHWRKLCRLWVLQLHRTGFVCMQRETSSTQLHAGWRPWEHRTVDR